MKEAYLVPLSIEHRLKLFPLLLRKVCDILQAVGEQESVGLRDEGGGEECLDGIGTVDEDVRAGVIRVLYGSHYRCIEVGCDERR